jgi:hypothetical protein
MNRDNPDWTPYAIPGGTPPTAETGQPPRRQPADGEEKPAMK